MEKKPDITNCSQNSSRSISGCGEHYSTPNSEVLKLWKDYNGLLMVSQDITKTAPMFECRKPVTEQNVPKWSKYIIQIESPN